MNNYLTFYQRIASFFNTHPLLKQVVLFLNQSITSFMYILYPALLLYFYLTKRPISEWGLMVIVPGISFVLLSLFRKVINAPRPYEEWPIQPLLKRDKTGESFPSRHVFSSTMISMCILKWQLLLGLVCLILTLLLAFCRVAVGVHYPKDVIVGILIGVLCGSLMFILG
ncbi:phosphatase PAP2 family protein [Globicatella sulfidifaciens]